MSSLVVLDNHTTASRQLADARPRFVASVEEAHAVLREPRVHLWVAPRQDRLSLLTQVAVQARGEQRLLVLERVSSAEESLLRALFRVLISPKPGVRLLPTDELMYVLASSDRSDRFIGGFADRESQSVVLYRGDFQPLLVPFSAFRPSGDGTAPEFSQFTVTDYGQTVALGSYESAASAILYDVDPDFRRTYRKQLREEDQTFGGSLRRLRLQRGLTQADFAPITGREIARIERGEVSAPRASTLQAIASRLGVRAEDIASY